MPKITITAEDIRSIVTMEAGWKPVVLKAVKHEPSKDRNSMNYVFVWDVFNGDGDNREVSSWVNDKNRKMLVEGLVKIYEALFDIEVDDTKNLELEPETWIGLKCFGEFSKELLGNRMVNNLVNLSAKQPF